MSYKQKMIFTSIAIAFITILIISKNYKYEEKNLLNVNSLQGYPVEVIQNGPRDEKVIALTFDDGPHPIYTVEILDLLKKYEAKATFFVLGRHAEFHPELILREKKEGHEIGVHSFNHIDVREEKPEIVEAEFNMTQDTIEKIAGERSTIYRPPYGIRNEAVEKVASDNNCRIILWTYYHDSKDWSNPGVDVIVNTVLTKAQNGDIVLFHDHNESEVNQTVEALEIILPELIEKGYRFVTISELLDS